MGYIDLHCDTLMKCYLEGMKLRENPAQIDLHRLTDAQCIAQCMAIFIPTHDNAQRNGVNLAPWDYFRACYDVYLRELDANKYQAAPATTFYDIAGNDDAHILSIILTVEDGVIVDGDMGRLDELRDLGVRLITLTWNYENCFGFPHSFDSEAMKLGLKPFGIEAVQHMNDLGIIVDVSHLSEGGFDDVARYSRKPFTASHSCCRSLCESSRNLNDRQLKLLGEKGGVCGVNFVPYFLESGSEYASISSVVRHIVHIADKAGIDAAAFGSDFDGFTGEVEFNDCAGMPRVIGALAAEFHESEIDKICRTNASRLFRDNFVP